MNRRRRLAGSGYRSDVIRGLQRGRLRLLAYIRSLVCDVELAEEVFQELSVVVLEKAGSYDPDHDVEAWFRGIARNLVRRVRSGRGRQIALPGARLADLVDTAFEENRDRDMIDEKLVLLRRCMGKLTNASREMLRMRHVLGLGLDVIAERSGRTRGAVQTALSRTRRAVARCVERAESGSTVSVGGDQT
jgi:RNA polymerase sigma factor (sigma-70 family)